jgi:hypothetical protein
MSLDEYLWHQAHAGKTTTYLVTHNSDGSSTLTAVGTSLVETQANFDYVSTGNTPVDGVFHYYYYTWTGGYSSEYKCSWATLQYHDLGIGGTPGVEPELTLPEFIALGGAGRLGRSVGVGAVRQTAAKQAIRAIDPTKLHHIFGFSKHKLVPLLTEFGSREAAYDAVEGATQRLVQTRGITGVFTESVQVGAQSVVVQGTVIDGSARIGSFWIP